MKYNFDNCLEYQNKKSNPNYASTGTRRKCANTDLETQGESPSSSTCTRLYITIVSDSSFITNFEIKKKECTSYILPTSSLASSVSTAIPEVVSAVEACAVSLYVR